MQGEAESADVEAAASYPDLAGMIHERGSTKHQLCNVDKTSSYVYIAKQQKSYGMPWVGQKVSLGSGTPGMNFLANPIFLR